MKEVKMPALMLEPVTPKGGGLVKEKPLDSAPILERVAILDQSYEQLEQAINATDTSRITIAETAALNALKRAYQTAREAHLELLK